MQNLWRLIRRQVGALYWLCRPSFRCNARQLFLEQMRNVSPQRLCYLAHHQWAVQGNFNVAAVYQLGILPFTHGSKRRCDFQSAGVDYAEVGNQRQAENRRVTFGVGQCVGVLGEGDI